MELFNGTISITGVTLLLFCVAAIAAVGYAIGRITIKGVALETAGVFLVALIVGCTLYPHLDALYAPGTLKSLLSVVKDLGLVLFVTSVGFIAGPNFFGNLKRNFKSYVLLGLVIILAGGLTTAACIGVGQAAHLGATPEETTFVVVGLMSGALTSTPAYSAAGEAAEKVGQGDAVSAGYGIAYIFGVIGVVLFVQLLPKLTKANVEKERALLNEISASGKKREYHGKLIHMDGFGFMPFLLAAVVGIFIGQIAFGSFSLTTTGGCMFAALIFGHFGHIGPVSIMPDEKALKVLRELGLMLFLIGSGISCGARFVEIFHPVYFIFGIFITLVPMIVGFLFAKYVLKLSLFNNLGSITGGMTSTPALGTLISVTGTENVSAAYAATYPIALIAVVLVSQVLILIF